MLVTLQSVEENEQLILQHDCLYLIFRISEMKFVVPFYSNQEVQGLEYQPDHPPIEIILNKDKAAITFKTSLETRKFYEWLKEADKVSSEHLKQWLVKVL